MKKLFTISILILFCASGYAQQSRIDSLLAKLDHIDNIKNLPPVMEQLVAIPKGDFALTKKGKQELAAAQQSGTLQKQQRALLMICTAAFSINDTPELLDAALQGIQISRQLADNQQLGYFLHSAGVANFYQHEARKGNAYSYMAAKAHGAAGDITSQLRDYSNIESSYVHLKM